MIMGYNSQRISNEHIESGIYRLCSMGLSVFSGSQVESLPGPGSRSVGPGTIGEAGPRGPAAPVRSHPLQLGPNLRDPGCPGILKTTANTTQIGPPPHFFVSFAGLAHGAGALRLVA